MSVLFPNLRECSHSQLSDRSPLCPLARLRTASLPLPSTCRPPLRPHRRANREKRRLSIDDFLRKQRRNAESKAYRARVRTEPSKTAAKAAPAARLKAYERTSACTARRQAWANERYRKAQESKGCKVMPYTTRYKTAKRPTTPPVDVAMHGYPVINTSGNPVLDTSTRRIPVPTANTGAAALSPLRSQEAAYATPGSLPDVAWFDNVLSTHIDPDLFKDLALK